MLKHKTLVIDIMKINTIQLIVTISQNIKFGVHRQFDGISEKLSDTNIFVNISSRDELVPENNKTVKEWV